MKKSNGIIKLLIGLVLLLAFAFWTAAIQIIDVKQVGVNGTTIGFFKLNLFIHEFIGVHLTIYLITDWLGLIPLVICFVFASMGLIQLITRKSLLNVDQDILILGVYYAIVIFCYLIFEAVPINYRPILIDGNMEASYPSSTTLLVLCVMSSLVEQTNRRVKNSTVKNIIAIISIIFSILMVFGRLISGVHWFTDIVGSILLSFGLFYVYNYFAQLFEM